MIAISSMSAPVKASPLDDVGVLAAVVPPSGTTAVLAGFVAGMLIDVGVVQLV
jgi:hypothetical protein